MFPETRFPPSFKGKIPDPMNPYDFDEGADFNLVIVRKDGNLNYDESSFEESSSFLDGDEEKIEAVWNQCHLLQPFLAESNFKSYEELEKRLFRVLGLDKIERKVKQEVMEEVEEKAPRKMKEVAAKPTPSFEPDEDDDEDADFLRKLGSK